MSKAEFFATQDLEEIFFECLPQYIICFFVQLSSSWHALSLLSHPYSLGTLNYLQRNKTPPPKLGQAINN